MTALSMTRDEVREIDRRAVEEYAMPSIVLMENAGRGTAELLMKLGIAGPVVICAGRGNNGGDGFVVARHLENHGYAVRVLLFADPDQLRGDAAVNARILQKAETSLRVFSASDADSAAKTKGFSPSVPFDPAELEAELDRADWVVDALLGTGTRGEVREPFATVIDRINGARKKVLAVDLPSGLDCDTGEPLGPCVRADQTATFVARKKGFDRPTSEQWTGQVHVIDIGIPRRMVER